VSNELARIAVDGDPLVRIRLVPVEVFGADEEDCEGCGETVKCGYGLMDAVQAWSDCNRAIGHIFRKDDDYTEGFRTPGDTITVYVPQSEMAKFEKRYGDGYGDRCPACHVRYDELPEGHTVNRPACMTAKPPPRRRETCRYCHQEVILGKHGWRLDNNSTSGNTCEVAPRGYHGIVRAEKSGQALISKSSME
jgi:hypothetical protein